MDRVTVNDAQITQAVDILNSNKFAMVGLAFLSRAMVGGNTAVHGLACNPTSPASMQVTIGAGSIYQLDEVDATAYGDLGTDTNTILKQGILYNPATETITAPSTSGYSQVFLVQAILNDVDGGSEVASYYNPAILTDPLAAPFAGPSNDGLSQFTKRTCVCSVALKAGAAAPTGTQTTPSPDAGYVGLFAITVANGQTTITSGNIAQLTTAPFFPTLPAIPGDVQNQLWVGFNDTGAANAYVITPQPAIAAYNKYQKFVVKIANTNTGPSTLNANGLGTQAIILPGGYALVGAELVAGMIAEFTYDGSAFELTSPQSTLRRKLSGNLTVYVRTDGNDSNNGLTNTSGGAFATIQGCWNKIASLYDFNGFAVTITLGIAGTYAGAQLSGNASANSVTIEGGDTTTYIIPDVSVNAGNQSCITSTVQNLLLNTLLLEYSYNGAAVGTEAFVVVQGGGMVTLTNVVGQLNHNRTNFADLTAISGTIAIGSISLGGAFSRLAFLQGQGYGEFAGTGALSINIGTGTTVVAGFVSLDVVSIGSFNGFTFSGSGVTGPKYQVNRNSVLFTGGVTIPGSISGTYTNGGVVT
jgi:hypothetical protein